MKCLMICIICVLISACSVGPIKVTHEEGHLPKVHVDMPSENLKLRVKKDEMKLSWKAEF